MFIIGCFSGHVIFYFLVAYSAVSGKDFCGWLPTGDCCFIKDSEFFLSDECARDSEMYVW